MSKGPVVVCMGEALVDFVATEIGVDVGQARTFMKASGGAVANTAVGLARLDINSRFVSKVGSDPFGRFLREALSKEGVDTSAFLVSEKYPTGLVFVALDKDRVPRYHFIGDTTADMMITEDEVGPELLKDAVFLHAGSVSMVREESLRATFKLIRLANELKVKVSFDPNFRLHLWKDHEKVKALALEAAAMAELIKLNREELRFMTGEEEPKAGARKLLEMGVEVVVVTLGPDGAYYLSRDSEGMEPGFCVEVVDTTGAGDGFSAGLLAVLAYREWPPLNSTLAHAVRLANAVGAMVTTAIGAVSSLPSRPEVDSFLERKFK